MALWRVEVAGSARLAVGPPEQGPSSLLPPDLTIRGLLAGATPFTSYRSAPTEPLDVAAARVVAPIDDQEVWASGVTFEQSRYAREIESTVPDHYRDVYFAERPELFLKAVPGTVVGPEEPVGLRRDSDWNVPEPELGLVVDATGGIVALTLGNDVSSRAIEGANPLYLPQAKIYDRSCAVGPCLVPVDEAPGIDGLVITLEIRRGGEDVFSGTSTLAELKRTPEELASWLLRARSFPAGVVLLTGTGIVPPTEFTLAPGDEVVIAAAGLGTLANRTVEVGR